MKKKTAFVFGGGGARGALQVGALKALLEAGYYPDIVIGSSIGAVNAAFFAIHGLNQQSVEKLNQAWCEAATANLLPASYLWLSVRALFNKPPIGPVHHMQDFFIKHGIQPHLRFQDIKGVQLFCVACDLNSGCCVLYGKDPEDLVLDATLASTALPPWATLVENNGSLLMDGGALSNLPLEQAVGLGATEIIALDLNDTRNPFGDAPHFGPFLVKLISSIHTRQTELEIALAECHRVPVRHLRLQGPNPVPIWDFRDSMALIKHGYTVTKQEIINWPRPEPSGWLARWNRWKSSKKTIMKS